MNRHLKTSINKLAQYLGLRVVNRNWGPRGFMATFEQLKAEGFSPKVIYDVGASDGSWSLELRSIFPESAFVLFEPLPEYENRLKRMAEGDEQLNYMRCALGKTEASMGLTSHGGQSSLLPSDHWSAEQVDVRVCAIDNLVHANECPSPDLIKADIQGYELEMIKGAECTLKSCSFLFLEVSWNQLYEGGPYAGDVLGFLASQGFHVYDICSYSARPYDNRLTQSDVLFAHERTGLFESKRWS